MDCLNLSSHASEDTCTWSINSTAGILAPYVDDRYIAACILALSTYLLFSLTAYEIERWRGTANSDTSIVNKLVLASSFVGFIYGIRIVLGLNVAFPDCKAYNYVGAATYAVSQSLIYTVLWARQRRFYADPLLCQSVNKVLKMLSAVIIVLIYLVEFTVPFSIITYFCGLPTERGCVFVWDRTLIHSKALPVMCASFVFCFVCQIALFFLITHPLLAKKDDKPTNFCYALCSEVHQDIFIMVKRLGSCAVICVLASLVLHAVAVFDALGYICVFWPNFMCLDLLVSNTSLTFTFIDWKQRLIPFSQCFLLKRTKKRAIPFHEDISNTA